MKNEICVPEGALSMAGEGGEGVAPAVGDEVEFTGKGRVTRSEGGNAYIEVTEANGQPVAGMAEAGPMMEGDTEGDMDAMVEREKGRVGYV